MKKKNINFEQKINFTRKISIKALDFEKLPKKIVGNNFKANTFLNITRSSSNLCIENLPSSLNKQNKKTYLMKPMTSRSRNENAIKLNEIPKTTYINATPVQRMKQLSRNKPLNNLFTQSLYVSNNNSSAKCITFNANNNLPNNNQYAQLNIINKGSANKGAARNLSNPNIFVNNSAYSIKIKKKDNINVTGSTHVKKLSDITVSNNCNIINNINLGCNEYGNKSSTVKNLLINGYKSNSNGKNFRGTISNVGPLSFRKFGIKVKKNKLLQRDEDQPFYKERINRVLNLDFFKKFNKLRIFILWRIYINEIKKDYKYYQIHNFLEKKIIHNYYKNKVIRKYNQIKKEEKKWKKFEVSQNDLEVNEYNKGSIFNSLYENANITIQNIFYDDDINDNNYVMINSISIYIFELMINKIYSILCQIKYVFKYYYDSEKRIIIKKPSTTDIKDLLIKLNRIIDKPNFKNKVYQDFVINNSKNIANLCLNKIQTKPIVTQYLEFYKGSININYNEIKSSLQFGNIYNDFSSLQVKDNKFIIHDIQKLLKECELQIITKYIIKDFDDTNDYFFILLYKLQPIKYDILSIEQKISSLNQKDLKISEELKEIKNEKEKITECLNIISIETIKNNQIIINDKNNEEAKVLSFLLYNTIKYNILYKNLNEILPLLRNNKNFMSVKINNEIYDNYNKLINERNNSIEYNIYLCLYEKFIKLVENQKNNSNENEDIKLLYLLTIYKEELNSFYEKIKVSEDNAISQKLNYIYNNINKYNDPIEKLKEKVLITFNNRNKNKKLTNQNNYNFNEIYSKIISHYIKYDIHSKNDNNNISILEKILFKQISLQENNECYNNNNDRITLLKKVNDYYNNKDNKLLNQLNNDYYRNYSKTVSVQRSSKQKKETLIYPRILFLSDDERNYLCSVERISLPEISKYYELINNGQEIEINKNSNNRSIISGIKIYNENKTEYELFKLNNPINVPYPNKESKNILNYLSSLYKNLNLEIETSLTKQLMQSLNYFSKKEFHEWANSTFNQITICTLCLIFTHEISKILVSDNSKEKLYLKDYKLINEKYNNFLCEDCAYIKNLKDRINIILTIKSQMNMIDSLIKNDVSDINSFNWLKYIRHLWDKNKKAVIIECGGWANYQMKKLNKYRYKMLLSPDSDKIFLFNSSCFREKSASIIKVINNKYNNTSYKEIFNEYCSLFWTEMITVNPYVMQNDEMKKIFDICTIDCSWIYIDNLDFYKTGENNNIENLIYFSKFIQTIQQEVILNDIKSNEGEKMFCLMGCINVDYNIKNKCEYLKGSSRILNFIKPDIEFYLSISSQIYQNLKNEKINQFYLDLLNKKEKIIREKLKGFYFDFDFFNEYIFYLNKSKSRNIINSGANIEDLFTSFINSYSNKFITPLEKNYIDENVIGKYFEKKRIIYDNERIKLYQYLYSISQNKAIIKTIIIKGYGRHFIINAFIDFYLSISNQKLNFKNNCINNNINIIFQNDNEEKENLSKKDPDFIQIFHLSPPKGKNFVRVLFDNLIIKLRKMNYQIKDLYLSQLFEYILSIITKNNNDISIYRTMCNYNRWLLSFFEYIDINKKKINDIVIFNIINECLFLSLGNLNERNKEIIDVSKKYIDSKINKQIIEIMNSSNNFFFYDIDKMTYRIFNNIIEFICSLKQYLDLYFPKLNYMFIFSELFANKNNRDIDNIFLCDGKKYIITEYTESFSNSININHNLKIYVGFNESFKTQNSNLRTLYKDKLQVITKKNNFLIDKYLYILANINIKALTNDELIFIYNSIDLDSKNIYTSTNINHPLEIIQNIFVIFPKANYYIIDNINKLLIYLLKNVILKGSSTFLVNSKKLLQLKSSCNNILFDFDQILISKIIYDFIFSIVNINILKKCLLFKLNISNEEVNNLLFSYFDNKDLLLLTNMINDVFNIASESSFKEKYPNNHQYYEIFIKIFKLLNIEKSKQTNDNYYNCREIIQILKFGEINEESLNYKCLYRLSEIFNNNTSKINDISILINNTLSNYQNLISSKNEFINSKFFYFKSMKLSFEINENIYNSIQEKIYLSMSNHFLFSLLLTFEIMLKNFHMSLLEKEFILDYVKANYYFPSQNVIKFKYENENENFKISFMIENGKKLIDFYTQKSKSIDDNYLALLKQSLDRSNNKYFYTSSLKKISRDVDKLLYYVTFVPDQSSSIFKYLINKYLIKIMNFSKFNINDVLRKSTTKENIIPITVNAFPSINVINFLCSLSAYYEINFYIVRDCNIYDCNDNKNNFTFGYQYLIDTGLFDLIKEGLKKGYWILICEEIDLIKFMKIMWELYSGINEVKINENFKLFFDEQLIKENCQKAIESMTMLININNENVDDLEAAHDIWVNVLEEKLLTESIMNQTQKDILDIIDNDTSEDKSNNLDFTITNTHNTKSNNILNTGNSIVSIKSIYNNSNLNCTINNKDNNRNDLNEITNWTFLKNI